MGDMVHEWQSLLSPAVTQGVPAKVLKQGCGTHSSLSPGLVIDNRSACLCAQGRLYPAAERGPTCLCSIPASGILLCNTLMICLAWAVPQVARYHMQRGVGFLSNQVGLLVPVEIVTDGNSEVLCLRDGAQDCPTHLIKLVQSAPPVYVRDVALGLKVIPQRTASCGDYQGPVEKLFGRSYSGFAGTRGTHLRRGGCRYLRRLVMAYHWYRSGKSSGLRTVPCGTPEKTGVGSELSPSTTINSHTAPCKEGMSPGCWHPSGSSC